MIADNMEMYSRSARAEAAREEIPETARAVTGKRPDTSKPKVDEDTADAGSSADVAHLERFKKTFRDKEKRPRRPK